MTDKKNLVQWESARVCPEAHKKKTRLHPHSLLYTHRYRERGGGLVFFIIIHLLIVRLCRLKSEIRKTDEKASEDEMLKMRETYEERLRRTEEENQVKGVRNSFALSVESTSPKLRISSYLRNKRHF